MGDINVNNDYKDMVHLTPFKACVLQNFPFIEADFDAVTNYQLLCKVVEYLNKLIDNSNKQNDNITQLEQNFITLYNYVKDYFDNLDVQDEINNKLDEMAASGELEQIYFKFVGYVTPEMYGAKGDGVSDDTDSFISCLANNKTIFLNSNSKYLLSRTIELDNNTIIYGNNAQIITASTFNTTNYKALFVNKNTSMTEYNDSIYIYNLRIKENESSNLTDGIIHLRGTNNSVIENLIIETNSNNSWGIISFSANSNLLIKHTDITNNSNNLGGCVWIRSGLENGASSSVTIENSVFTSYGTDEILAINSGVDVTNIKVNINYLKINSNGTNTAPFIITNKNNSIIDVSSNNLVINAVNSNNIIIIGTTNSNNIKFFGTNLDLVSNKAGIISRTDNSYFYNSNINTGGLSALRCTLYNCTVKDQTENCYIYNSILNGMVINPNRVINSVINSISNYGISILNTSKEIYIINNIIKANSRAVNNNSTPFIICSNNIVSRINNNNNNTSIGLYSTMENSTCIFTNNIIYTTNNIAKESFGFQYASGLKSGNTITANVNYGV